MNETNKNDRNITSRFSMFEYWSNKNLIFETFNKSSFLGKNKHLIEKKIHLKPNQIFL